MAKIVFCQRIIYAFFGTMSISAVLKKHGHEVELVMGENISNNVREILKLSPDFVAFSTITAAGEFEWANAIAAELKSYNNNIISIFGNLHPTLFPQDCINSPYVDIICRGEGEFAFLELCNKYDAKVDFTKIPGLWIKQNGKTIKNDLPLLIDIDKLPFLDRDLYQKYNYFKNVFSIDVMAGRGCIFNCSYCYNGIIHTLYNKEQKFARKYKVDRLISELQNIKSRYDPSSFTFVDELFITDKKWILEFSEKYHNNIHMPFICNIQAAIIDEETIEALAFAGAKKVCFGIESGNEKIRRNLLNKNISNQQIINTAQLLHKHGIKFLTANILGLPEESIDMAFETVLLNRKIKTDYLYFSIFQPYPALKITKYCFEQGLLNIEDSNKIGTTYFKRSPLKQLDIKKLERLHKIFYLAVKIPIPTFILKFILNIPANYLFELIFIASFGWMQLKCFSRNPRQLLYMGLGNLKIFYNRRQYGA